MTLAETDVWTRVMPASDLIKALDRGPCGPALDQAFAQLPSGGDLDLVMAMVKAMTRDGIPGLAARLLRAAGELLKQRPDLVELAHELESLPSGKVDPSVVERRFRHGLDSLLARHEALRDQAGVLTDVGARISVYEATGGHVYAIRDHDDLRLDFALPPIAVGGEAIASIVDAGQNTTVIAMSGVPAPASWRSLLGLQSSSGFRIPLELVEPDPVVLGVWLRTVEAGPALKGGRVGVYLGPAAHEQYIAALLADPHRMLPSHFLVNHRGGVALKSPPRSMFASVARTRLKARESTARRLDIKFGGRDRAWWGGRFRDAGRSGPPLRVAGFTTRHSTVIRHAIRDLGQAFRRAGCDFEVICEPNDFTSDVDVAGALAQREIDLIVVINHGRFEFGDQVHGSIPYVLWIQDYMDRLWTSEAGRSIGDLDLVLGHSPDAMAMHYGYPEDRLIATTNLTDAVAYDAESLPDEELEPFRCDLSYVSHAAGTTEELIGQMTGGSDPVVAQLLRHLAERIVAELEDISFVSNMRLASLLMESEAETRFPPVSPDVRYRSLLHSAARLCDRIFRHQTLGWAARWAESRGRSLRIYGRGWEQHPTLAKYAAGEIENGEALRRVYQASKINIQVNGYGSMHQRLLDGLACGAFMLIRFHPADVLKAPYAVMQRAILKRGMGLADLHAARDGDDDLAHAIREVQRLDGVRIAPRDDPERRVQIGVIRDTLAFAPERCHDDDLLRRLTTLPHMPSRAAGDLPGYEACAFADGEAFHEALDRYVDAPDLRRTIAAPMRASVLHHDTTDALVHKVLEHFSTIDQKTAIPVA